MNFYTCVLLFCTIQKELGHINLERMLFEELGLSNTLCQRLSVLGFDTPTPIQEKAIPLVLQGQDIVASAQTGSGKTASFLLPLLHILGDIPLKARMPRAIIMEPTRELAQQVYEQFDRFSDGVLKAALLVGGESMTQQERVLKTNPDVLIVTPGRLLDLCEREKLMLFGIRYVVIDEADRMLDMGFLPDVTRIMEKIPMSRQTMLFSATFSDEIQSLTRQFMLAPKIIAISRAGSTVASIDQYALYVDDKQKRTATRYLLKTYGVQDNAKIPSIIFCNRKTDVTTLVSSLKRHGFAADSLHGDLQQSTRNQTLERFRSSEVHVLVASDVAARGLDVVDLGLVINFNVPINAEDYVHRIGRTGRAGKTGIAVTLIEKRDQKLWKAVEALTQQSIVEMTLPEDILSTSLKVKAVEPLKTSHKKKTAQSIEKTATEKSTQKNNDENKNVAVASYHKGTERGHSFVSGSHTSVPHKNYPSSEYDRITFKGFGDSIPAFFKQESYRAFFALSEATDINDETILTDDVKNEERRLKPRNRSKKRKLTDGQSADHTADTTEKVSQNDDAEHVVSIS